MARARETQLSSDLEDVRLALDQERLVRQQVEDARKLEAEQHATKVSYLERQRRYMSDREEKATKELRETQEEFEQSVASLRARVQSLEAERFTLQRHVSQDADTARGTAASQQRELAALRQQADLHEHELQQAQAEVARHRRLNADLAAKAREAEPLRQTVSQHERTLRDVQTQLQQAQQELEQLKSTGLSREGSASDERRYRKTQRENEYLKQVVENNSLLEEKLLGAQEQVKRLQAHLETVIHHEVETEDLLKLKQEWETLRTLPGW